VAKELGEIRREIDAIDEEMARLFVRRLQAADAVAEAKRVLGKSVLDAKREEEVLGRAAAAVPSEFAAETRRFFAGLMSVSRARQQAKLSAPTAASVPCTVGIRGLGLIGGSFEKAFRQAGHEVINLKGASRDDFRRAELVIVCLPPLMVAPWIAEHAGDFAEDALVTDAAGVKGTVCAAVEPLARGAKWIYVGGHPMAGKEVSGYANSDAALFRGASMIFTPFADTPAAVVERLKALFAEVGFARFVITDPKRHDEMIAYTSQLAHVVSSAYVRDPLARSQVGFSAGSYQDMTRVATVDPDIWTDLFLANRPSLDAVLSRLIDRLSQYQAAIRAEDAVTMKALLKEGRAAKEDAH